MDPRALDHVTGKKILVTGGAGSIGSELCRQVVKAGAAQLTLLSLTESGLYNINRQLRAMKGSTQIVPILGSVTNEKLMDELVVGQDIVVHAAAHKHVPICEDNPLEAIMNNVLGTKTLLDAAVLREVPQFLYVSTDKAVKPKSVMGMTKRVAEMAVERVAARNPNTRLNVVRFGNVLDSAGSVLPLWREQIAAGGPITLTDERCERYFMSIPEACELILGTLSLNRWWGKFVFAMGKPRRMYDIARELIEQSGKDCAIQMMGLRPGEKLTEELYTGGEMSPTPHPRIIEVSEPHGKTFMVDDLLHAAHCRLVGRSIAIMKEMTDGAE